MAPAFDAAVAGAPDSGGSAPDARGRPFKRIAPHAPDSGGSTGDAGALAALLVAQSMGAARRRSAEAIHAGSQHRRSMVEDPPPARPDAHASGTEAAAKCIATEHLATTVDHLEIAEATARSGCRRAVDPHCRFIMAWIAYMVCAVCVVCVVCVACLMCMACLVCLMCLMCMTCMACLVRLTCMACMARTAYMA
ncbi:MAG: hypothetical protein U0575_16750 [Phycisphaerales bacterium]